MDHKTVGLFQAKTHLSRLVEEVRCGALVTITKHGIPVAELRAIQRDRPRAQRGAARSADFFMSADFDAPMEGFEAYT